MLMTLATRTKDSMDHTIVRIFNFAGHATDGNTVGE